jgi:hypothetical protein
MRVAQSLLLSSLSLGLAVTSSLPLQQLLGVTAPEFLSIQTEQKDDASPHRGSGRRGFNPNPIPTDERSTP